MVPDLEDVYLEICSTIDNSGFGVGIGITDEQEGNASLGHLQDDGVLVDSSEKVAVGFGTVMVSGRGDVKIRKTV